jgi:hypothetical protein
VLDGFVAAVSCVLVLGHGVLSVRLSGCHGGPPGVGVAMVWSQYTRCMHQLQCFHVRAFQARLPSSTATAPPPRERSSRSPSLPSIARSPQPTTRVGSLRRSRCHEPWPERPGRSRRVRSCTLGRNALLRATLHSSTACPELRPDRHDTDSPAVLVKAPIAVSYVMSPSRARGPRLPKPSLKTWSSN